LTWRRDIGVFHFAFKALGKRVSKSTNAFFCYVRVTTSSVNMFLVYALQGLPWIGAVWKEARVSRPHHHAAPSLTSPAPRFHLHLDFTCTSISQLCTLWHPSCQHNGKTARESSTLRLVSVVPRSHLLFTDHLCVAFASGLSHRLNDPLDASVLSDSQLQIHGLPLPASSTVSARQEDLDKLGTELWNLITRLQRDESANSGKKEDEIAYRRRTLCLVRCYSFLLLDSACNRTSKDGHYKNCIRLMKVALKAARISIESNELESATKVLERAAGYQEILNMKSEGQRDEEAALAGRLQAEYFAVRTTLVSVIDTQH
jgi:hypothetical protein